MSQRRGLQIPKLRKNSRISSSVSKNSDLNNNSLMVTKPPQAEETFIKWQRFIEEQVGFVLPKNQTHWLWHAVNRLAEAEQKTQIDLLSEAMNNRTLKQKIIDAVLIPQSRFFRHKPSIAFIEEQAKIISEKRNLTVVKNDDLANANPTAQDAKFSDFESDKAANVRADFNKDVRVWSVGCSYGQEVWSIAMVLSNLKIPHQIWGADVNESALKHAVAGSYNFKQLDEIPVPYKNFAVIHEKNWQVSHILRQNTAFLKYNLFATQLPDLPPIDMIICQNVLIYFRQFDQRDILGRLITKLKIGGYLILSPGEASQWHHPLMQKLPNLQVNVWQRIK